MEHWNVTYTETIHDMYNQMKIQIVVRSLLLIPNVLLLIALLKTRKNNTLVGKLFIGICISDVLFLFGHIIMSLGVFFYLQYEQIHLMQGLLLSITTFLQSVGIVMFTITSYLRYYSLKEPFSFIDNKIIYRHSSNLIRPLISTN
eukprot:TCONS_00055846-protein